MQLNGRLTRAMNIKALVCFILLIIVFCSCNLNSATRNKKHPGVPGVSDIANSATYNYDLVHPQKTWTLTHELFEISGNTWIDDNHLLVIEDLHPNLYLVRLDDKPVVEKTIPFEGNPDKKFDIEDVTIVDNTAYAIWSHGIIYKIADWRNKPRVKEIRTFLTKDNNTEGMCYDPLSKNILVACKDDCGVENEKKSTRAVYEFNIKTETLNKQPLFLIHKSQFEKIAGSKVEFFPSAIAVHPITHDIYILSTRENKCLACFSHSGELKSVQFINKELLPQPEGICFSPDGKMYISSEGKDGLGVILQFTSR